MIPAALIKPAATVRMDPCITLPTAALIVFVMSPRVNSVLFPVCFAPLRVFLILHQRRATLTAQDLVHSMIKL